VLLERVAASLPERAIVIGVVRRACREVRRMRALEQAFVDELVSAVSEAFNNIVLHGHAHRMDGFVDIVIDCDREGMSVTLSDRGHSFDIRQLPPADLAEPGASGKGVFILRSFVDELDYRPGEVNHLRLRKRFRA
jgi:serine/threonine-protein kinase RsbW